MDKLKGLDEQEQPKEEKDKIAEVVDKTRKVKSDDELSAEDWSLKGYNAFNKRNYEDACFYYKKSIKLKPDFVTYKNIGNSLLKMARMRSDEALFRESIENYKKAIELKPDYEIPYNNWGNALLGLARLKTDENLFLESFEKYMKAIELKPEYVMAYKNWGIALKKWMELNLSDAMFKKLVAKYKLVGESNPEFKKIYNKRFPSEKS